jgi:RHS repeat-associated protein
VSHVYTFTAASTFSATALVAASDRATNGTTAPFTVVRDETPPQVSLSAPARATSTGVAPPRPDTFTVTWGASDAQAGLAYYDLDVSVDGGPWQRVLTHTQATTYQQTNQPANYYTFRLTATDHVSNSASVEARTSIPVVTKYYYHGGQRVAMRAGGVVYYLHADHLGSTSLTTDAGGRVVARQLYHPYGTVRYTEGTLPTDFGFAGQRHDGTGLVFMHARYYHAALGRFVSADTVVPDAGDSQALNRYLYVANNPLRFADPTGHSWLTDQLVALGQRSSVVRGLLVSTAEAVEALNDPVRSPTMEGIRQTAHGVTEGARAWGDAAGMAGVAVDYTAAAISEGRWNDAARGATDLGQMGQTASSAVQQATGRAALGIATAPFRDAWAFGVAAREYAAGERSGWDLAFHSLCLTGDVLAIGAAYNRLATPARPVNRAGVPYPKQHVQGYGEVPFPDGPIAPTSPGPMRAQFTQAYRMQYRAWWYGEYGWYPSPDMYQIHHILPLARGGTNAFENLVPLTGPAHSPFTSWWVTYP